MVNEAAEWAITVEAGVVNNDRQRMINSCQPVTCYIIILAFQQSKLVSLATTFAALFTGMQNYRHYSLPPGNKNCQDYPLRK